MLYLQPNFLIKQEKIDVVQEGFLVGFAHLFVAATSYHDAVVDWKELHAMAESSWRRRSRNLNGSKVAVNHLVINSDGSEVPQPT